MASSESKKHATSANERSLLRCRHADKAVRQAVLSPSTPERGNCKCSDWQWQRPSATACRNPWTNASEAPSYVSQHGDACPEQAIRAAKYASADGSVSASRPK
eukprot:1167441-Pyramimonas_sp.AAC.1